MAVTFPKNAIKQIVDRTARSISYTPQTKTLSNDTGDETFTPGTTRTFNAVFLKRSTKWLFDKDGLVQGGDAYCIIPYTVSITPAKNDTITVNSETFRIQDVIARYGDLANSTLLYYYLNLFRSA